MSHRSITDDIEQISLVSQITERCAEIFVHPGLKHVNKNIPFTNMFDIPNVKYTRFFIFQIYCLAYIIKAA